MAIGAFTDKAREPAMEDVLAALGPKSAAWEELTRFVRERYRVQEELRFYGKSYGWALRFRRAGKALVSLYPGQDKLTVQVVLSERQVQEALGLGLGDDVRRVVESAHPYPEGRWLFVEVRSNQDVADLRKLLALKAGSARSA